MLRFRAVALVILCIGACEVAAQQPRLLLVVKSERKLAVVGPATGSIAQIGLATWKPGKQVAAGKGSDGMAWVK